MSEVGTKGELMAEEDRLWSELHVLIGALTPEQALLPGYYVEGWSAKDLLAHIGSWLAEAGLILERIRFGTYHREEIDIDAMNAQFFAAFKDVAFTTIRSQATAARSRMLLAWASVDDDDPEAERWIRKSGPEHYQLHLPRLVEWVAELNAR